MKRVIICLALCIMMLAGIVGCGKGKVDDSKEISVWRWNFNTVNNAKKQNTELYKAVAGQIGDFTIKAMTTGSSNWETAINNLYNTGDLPDVFVSYAMDRPTTYKKWIRDEAVLPISDYVSATKYPNVYNRLKKYDYLAERIPYANGKHYSLPIETSLEHGMYVRTDWIEALNESAKLTSLLTDELGRAPTATELDTMKFKLPETLIEFYRLAKAFREYDPDNNQKKDTYGYTCSEQNMWFNNWIFEAYGAPYFGIVENNGVFTSSFVSEENKQAVAFLNKLYNEKVLDPDYTVNSSDTKMENFVTGKVGIMVGNIWYNTVLSDIKNAYGDATYEDAAKRFAIIAPPKGENGDFGMRGNAGFWCATSIRNNLSESKRNAVLAMLDYMLSDAGEELFTYGVEGVHYELKEGKKVSKMGMDKNGFNYTLESKDGAFALASLVSWKYSYYSPYQSNADLIIQLMDNAASYSRIEKIAYVQTPLYVDYNMSLSDNAMDAFVSMIGRNYGQYSDKTTANWSDLRPMSAEFNSDWSTYVNNFNTTWKGAEIFEEYTKVAAKYL